jgi:transposase
VYKERFKAEMVKRLLAPNGPTAKQLGLEVGVHGSTLSRWLQAATTLDEMPKTSGRGGRRPGSGRPPGSKNKPRERSAAEKLQIVLEAARLSEDELGVYLREKGLFEADLAEWREQMKAGLERQPPGRPMRAATPDEVRRMRALEREIRRKDKALAEAAALIVLKKKVQALWGAEDDDTDPTSEK